MQLLSIIYSLLRLVTDVLGAATLGVIERPRGWSYQRNVKYTLVRSLVKHNLFDIFIKPGPDTMSVYRAYMKEHGAKYEVVTLEQGAFGGWIGSPKAKSVLLFFHGGGYSGSAHPMVLSMLEELVAATQKQGLNFSVFFIQYGLTPKCQYPLQLVQGVHALKYLLDECKLDPRDIYIAGDSAGGNLAAGVIAHLSHPHSAAPAIELAEKKLGGAYFISPWVTFDNGSSSMETNKNRDYISATHLKPFSDQFIGISGLDGYNAPLIESPEWWKGLQVQSLCVVGGEYEIFLTDIESWAAVLKVYNPQTEFYCAPTEIHVGIVLDRALHLGRASSEVHFWAWIEKQLHSSHVIDGVSSVK